MQATERKSTHASVLIFYFSSDNMKCTHMDDAETTLGGAQLVTERSKK